MQGEKSTTQICAKPVRLSSVQAQRLATLFGVGLGLALGAAVGPFSFADHLAFDLPDFGRWLDWLRKLFEWLKLGGIAVALLGSAAFVVAWIVSHFRQASSDSKPMLGTLALLTSYVPVGLTILAALGTVIPTLAPFVIKAFALAVVVGAFSWMLAVVALVSGGNQRDLRRARKALLYAGTPWYTLALWIATKL
jgi:hypothetical protein